MRTINTTGPTTPIRTDAREALSARVGVGRRTGRGIASVAGSQAALRVVGLLGGVLLARLLSPKDFGIYSLTAFVVMQLGVVADLGLGAKLIHDSDEGSLRQKRSVFSVHLGFALFLYVAAYVSAPLIAKVFSLGDSGAPFCRVVALALLIFPFRAIPAAMLNRRLSFGLIAISEFVGGLVFQVMAVILAYAGCSYWSFAFALLASTAVRSIVLYIAYPWPVGFALDIPFLRGCIRFGSAFQLSSLTAVLRDNIINFLGGPFFGPTAVGLLSWALRLANYSSQTYVGICANVSFPSLSRIRSDCELFSTMLSKMLQYVTLCTTLTLSVVAGLAPQITHLIFTDKWLPAVPLFYWFAARMIAANYTTLLDLALKAQGKPGRSLKIMSYWTALEWLAAAATAAVVGYKGIAIASGICIWLVVLWLAHEVKKETRLRIWGASAGPIAAGAITCSLLHLVGHGRITTFPALLLAAIGGLCTFIAVYWLLQGSAVFTEIKKDVMAVLGGEPRKGYVSQPSHI